MSKMNSEGNQSTGYVELQNFPVVPTRRPISNEAAFYKKYRPYISEKKDGMITSMAFNPMKPAELVLTYGTKAEVYNLKSGQCSMRISSFKDFSQSASYRQDGKLIVCTDASGLVQVADMGSKKILRKLRGHEESATVARFGSTASILSAGNDKKLMLWDVAQGQRVNSTEGHTDYIKALQISPTSEHTWISGGYDKIVKVWDSRIAGDDNGMKCVMQFDHGKPVEDLVINPAGLVCMVAGGTEVKSWDLATGKVLSTFNHHTKAITGLAFNADASALLSSSLDCTMKVTDLVDYKVQMSYKMSAPSLCAAWASDNIMLAGGLQTGQWLVRRNKALIARNPATKPKRRLQPGTAQFFHRGKDHEPSAGDQVVEHNKKKQNIADFYFRSFEYQKLMDLVFKQRTTHETQKEINVGTSVTPFKLSVIDRLIQQGGLEVAVCPRNDMDCTQLVIWLTGALKDNVAYLPLVAETICHVLKNKCMQKPSAELFGALKKMNYCIMNEIVTQSNLLPVLGLLDLIMQ